MKIKLVKESLNDLFKPKTEEELGDNYQYLMQKTDEFMTKIFSDLRKNPNPKKQNYYINNKGKWMFMHDPKFEYIWVNYDRVWSYFEKRLKLEYNVTTMLIEFWLRQNTDWPHFKITC